MGHLGLTPQSVHTMGGCGCRAAARPATALLADALALQEAGAFALVLEVVPADLAERVTAELTIPTIGIGAGAGCDAQVLVWTDMAGLTPGRRPEVRQALRRPARRSSATPPRAFADEVRDGRLPRRRALLPLRPRDLARNREGGDQLGGERGRRLRPATARTRSGGGR